MSVEAFKSLGLWLLPVLLIPMMWPIYSVVLGQTDLWLQWVLWQTDRNRPLSISIMNFFQIDPLIAIIGIAGTGYAAIRRDFLPLLWIFPFLLFSSFVGWVQYFHLVLIFPAFCIAGAILIEFIQKYIAKYSTEIISFSVAGFICVFGFVTTTMLITLDVNSSYYQVYATIAEQIPDATDQENSSITLIGSSSGWDSY